MLSDDLRSVELFLARMASGELSATARDLYNLAVLVRCCRETAHHMEHSCVVAQVATPADLADGKVILFPVAGRDVHRLVNGTKTGPGGAA